MPKHTAARPDWELVLSSAARRQRILPDAVLVGGTASAIHAGHRFSNDADHVLTDLRYRNATRDYLDFVALADHMGDEGVVHALQAFDRLYPQNNGESALQQLQVQLANALPYDLKEDELDEYRNLQPRWQDWQTVKAACAQLAIQIFDRVCAMNAAP